jgi:hypothetical protein
MIRTDKLYNPLALFFTLKGTPSQKNQKASLASWQQLNRTCWSNSQHFANSKLYTFILIKFTCTSWLSRLLPKLMIVCYRYHTASFLSLLCVAHHLQDLWIRPASSIQVLLPVLCSSWLTAATCKFQKNIFMVLWFINTEHLGPLSASVKSQRT